ncbi:MAG: RNA-binding S4 domain-containing protein [Thermoanaerobaculia bacterium]
MNEFPPRSRSVEGGGEKMSDSEGRNRVDLWLKHVCLFRHRSEATDACRGGTVKLNERRVKPSAELRPNDVIEVTEPHYRKFVVLGLPDKQLSREAAREMYRDESPPPPPRTFIPEVAERERGAGRPTKRERRELEKWKDRG